jgi:hypothetical protein
MYRLFLLNGLKNQQRRITRLIIGVITDINGGATGLTWGQ